MPYTALALQRPIRIEQLISVHYFEFGPDYVFAGESHNFWELAYVDKGEIVAVAGETERPLRRGQMIFHAPGEFHSLRAAGQTAPNLVITAFCCEGPAMRFFEAVLKNIKLYLYIYYTQYKNGFQECFNGRVFIQ